MICNRFERSNDNGFREWCDLNLENNEIRIIIRALEYYTDKRKLDFDERMKAGDMARQIKNCPVEEV